MNMGGKNKKLISSIKKVSWDTDWAVQRGGGLGNSPLASPEGFLTVVFYLNNVYK